MKEILFYYFKILDSFIKLKNKVIPKLIYVNTIQIYQQFSEGLYNLYSGGGHIDMVGSIDIGWKRG
jgi:hypothetical protein